MQYLALVACYLFGAIPFGLMIGKITRGVDIRDYGSGNIGASNVLRTLGLGPALAVFFFDTVKGLAAVELCKYLGMGDYLVVAGGILSILGHNFSVFLGFKGGKGVATSLGMVIGLNPIIAGVTFVIWVTIVGVTRYISLASILAALSVIAMMVFWKARHVPAPYQVVGIIAAVLIVVKHRSNINRLLSRTETKIGQRVKLESKEGEDG